LPSAWLPDLEAFAPKLSPLSGSGKLRLSSDALVMESLSLSAGPATIAGQFLVELSDDPTGGTLDLQVQSPSASLLVPALEPYVLAQEPVTVSTAGLWSVAGLDLTDVSVTLAERGRVAGTVGLSMGPTPDLTVDLQTVSLDLRTEGDVTTESPGLGSMVQPQPDGQVIPPGNLPLAWLSRINLDFQLAADALFSNTWAGAQISTAGSLRDGRLEVSRFESDGVRGQLSGTFSAGSQDGVYGFDLKLEGQNLYVAAPSENATSLADRPSYDLSAALQAQGNTYRELAGSLSGRVNVNAQAGTIERRNSLLSTLIFQDTLTGLLETVLPFVRSRDELELSCLVVRLELENGRAGGDPFFALQTREVNLLARGDIDLASEALNLDVVAQPRRGLGISIGDLINPFTRVGGTLADPRIVADPRNAVIETGVGIATGGLWPLGKNLLKRFLDDDACTKAMAEPANTR
ncbi:MAG: AsmA-like C-terminal region-containing protein, partial [Pseudomonadota bacterium]